MGVYCYTFRKDFREVDGLKIGRISYAYKHSAWAKPSRTISRLDTMGFNAREALPDIEYVIQADSFDLASDYELPIYRVPEHGGVFLEEPVVYNPDSQRYEPKIVGYLTKVGRKFKVRSV